MFLKHNNIINTFISITDNFIFHLYKKKMPKNTSRGQVGLMNHDLPEINKEAKRDRGTNSLWLNWTRTL